MRYTIVLEAIGDNTYWASRGFDRLAGGSGAMSLLPRQHVKLVTGVNRDGLLRLRDEYGTRDYSRANSKGSRGVMVYYHLDNGFYQVRSPQSWSSSRLYYVHIHDGECMEVTEEEIRKWLSTNAASEKAC